MDRALSGPQRVWCLNNTGPHAIEAGGTGLEGTGMSEESATATATDELKLTPPEPLPPVAPAKAAGLVPLSTEQKSNLEERVDRFIDDLVAKDANSPEFGKRLAQITHTVRQEQLEAARQPTHKPEEQREG